MNKFFYENQHWVVQTQTKQLISDNFEKYRTKTTPYHTKRPKKTQDGREGYLINQDEEGSREGREILSLQIESEFERKKIERGEKLWKTL